MRIPGPRLYLGTMTFGWTSQTSSVVDESVSLEMVEMFRDHCKKTSSSSSSSSPPMVHIDTARIYSGGATEGILGSALKQMKVSSSMDDNIIVGSKAHPSWEMGGLSPKGIESQFKKSMEEVGGSEEGGLTSFGEYYLHQPDTEHSLLESLRCIDGLVADGLIRSFGMSNYHVTEMERAFELCEQYGLTKPTVCQSLYNPLNRAVETQLLPLLKANKCSFVAYNPLAAGLLTGKHHTQTQTRIRPQLVQDGRFKDNPNYLPRFYTDANFEAVQLIKTACDHEGVTLVDATFKWLLRHSALGIHDGILLGASSVSQLRQNLDACLAATDEGDEGLSDDIIQAFDDASKLAEVDAFPYWRSYSKDMPGRDDMDHGASYSSGTKQKK